LDPFGGSGTTFAVCEKKGREWIGTEIHSARDIADHLKSGDIHFHRNSDFIQG